MVDSDPVIQKLSRLANDPSLNVRHRRVILESSRIMKLVTDELNALRDIEALFENNERLQRVLAEELAKELDDV